MASHYFSANGSATAALCLELCYPRVFEPCCGKVRNGLLDDYFSVLGAEQPNGKRPPMRARLPAPALPAIPSPRPRKPSNSFVVSLLPPRQVGMDSA